jgi:hypothetical protein
MATREQLDLLLDQLEDALPILMEEHPHVRPFWPEFARAADVIEELASPENWDHVQGRFKRMLNSVGALLREDDESSI